MSFQLSCAVRNRDVDVALAVASGETLALLGPNGSGKSTALAVAAGLLVPDRGRVVLDGETLTDAAPSGLSVSVPPHARRTALLGQEPLLFPHLSVLENVAFGPRSRGIRKAAARESAHRWLEEVGVGELAERRPAQLSGGQAQRVVIARALAPQPDVLFLDEPLSQLDAKLRDELKLEIAEIHRQTGCTTLMVTHDQAEALTIADNVLLMDRGKLVQEGSPLELYRQPRTLFSADFIGTNNFLQGIITAATRPATVKLTTGEITLLAEQVTPGLTVGDAVWVCIRADDIDLIDPEVRAKYPNVVEA
ncbi:MAG TPA: ABC transporter ATP-binding protein, partial [Nocardioides sp.]|nr:ABC transporter ATP-binding protein [Nocardioides sp.]